MNLKLVSNKVDFSFFVVAQKVLILTAWNLASDCRFDLLIKIFLEMLNSFTAFYDKIFNFTNLNFLS